MESTTLLESILSARFTTPSGAAISLKQGDSFRWEPKSTTVFYDPSDKNAPALLLHELGHATLGHSAYQHDIQLVALERDAWGRAAKLAKAHGTAISDDITQDHLDTYRDWLHARSLCPACGATGVQIGANTYSCLSCTTSWRVNEARTCGLRRYKTQ